MSVKLSDLRKHAGKPNVRLYCPMCATTYSANAGDYFLLTEGEPLQCGWCPQDLQLVRHIPETYEVIK